ncbi:MAG: hypothetical protein N2747_11630, partial [Chitinophagaceae bacterium]|nr:hypothetical protein [Chitinophagaceae bacterium]
LEVKSIVKEVRTAGSYEFEWDGTDQLGNRVGSGVYVYRISVSDEQDNSMRIISSRKMILMR